jgi:hypothetical protein
MLGLAALVVSVAACGDDPLDPDARFDHTEAEAVMRSAAALPSLTGIAAGVSVQDPAQEALLVRARELWLAGAAAPDARGPAQRRIAAAYAAPVLAASLPASEWVRVRADVDQWQVTATRMIRQLPMPTVEARLADAQRNLVHSDAATSPEMRVYHLLLASSDLLETTPRFVARSLTRDASVAVRRAEARVDGDRDRSLERARRLADWAVQALDEEDHVRAIQRAYYAMQLVEGR